MKEGTQLELESQGRLWAYNYIKMVSYAGVQICDSSTNVLKLNDLKCVEVGQFFIGLS